MGKRRHRHYVKHSHPTLPLSGARDSTHVMGTYTMTLFDILKSGAADSVSLVFVNNTTNGLVYYAFQPKIRRNLPWCVKRGIYPISSQCEGCLLESTPHPAAADGCCHRNGQYALIYLQDQSDNPLMSFIYDKYLDMVSGSF